MGVEQQCLTFVLWRHCLTETRLEYSENIAKDGAIGLVKWLERIWTSS